MSWRLMLQVDRHTDTKIVSHCHDCVVSHRLSFCRSLSLYIYTYNTHIDMHIFMQYTTKVTCLLEARVPGPKLIAITIKMCIYSYVLAYEYGPTFRVQCLGSSTHQWVLEPKPYTLNQTLCRQTKAPNSWTSPPDSMNHVRIFLRPSPTDVPFFIMHESWVNRHALWMPMSWYPHLPVESTVNKKFVIICMCRRTGTNMGTKTMDV